MESRLKKIKAFVFDVDGVLTDGGLFADLVGEFYRTFDSKDGFAIRMAMMHGYHLGIITGGRSESIPMRFQACGIKREDVYLASRDKMEDFEDFCRRHSLTAEEVMYFGDDLPDAPVMMACGCGVAPADAVDEVKPRKHKARRKRLRQGVHRKGDEATWRMAAGRSGLQEEILIFRHSNQKFHHENRSFTTDLRFSRHCRPLIVGGIFIDIYLELGKLGKVKGYMVDVSDNKQVQEA